MTRTIPLQTIVDSVVGDTWDVALILAPLGSDVDMLDVEVDDFRKSGCPVITYADGPAIVRTARGLWIKPAIRMRRNVLLIKVRFRGRNQAGRLAFDEARFGKLDWSLVVDENHELLHIAATHRTFSPVHRETTTTP